MSTVAPTAAATAASAAARKYKALVAYLMTSPETQISDPHPIVANATVGDFHKALEEVERRTKCPLAATLVRWSGGKPLAIGAPSMDWRPVREARFKDMRYTPHRHGYSGFFWNPIEMIQICFRQNVESGKIQVAYHLQSLVCNETPSYYRLVCKRNSSAIDSVVRLTGLDVRRFSVQRGPTGAISSEMRDVMMKHKKFEAVDPLSMPLHLLVSTLRT